MKKLFRVPIDVEAYSQDHAQAKANFLIEMAAFFKDFDFFNLGGSLLKIFVIIKAEEYREKKELEKAKEKQKQKGSILCELAANLFKGKQQNATGDK